MSETKKTYVGAAVFFERLADDGRPEDTGWRPVGGYTSPPGNCSDERARRPRRLSPLQFMKSLWRSSNRT